jgi:hypothetical protein
MAYTLITYKSFVLQLKGFMRPLLHHTSISKYMFITINMQKVSYIQARSTLLLRGS